MAPRPAKKATKAVKKVAKKAVKAPDEELLLPSGVNGDLIPVNLLLRYNTFVQSYLETLDACEAAREAGWIGKNKAQQQGYAGALLRNVYIRTMIDRQYRAIIAKTGATVERVWEEISHIAFLDPGEAFNSDGTPKPMEEIPEHVRRAISGRKRKVKVFGEDGEEVTEEVKFASKDAALDKLMRLHRMTDNDKYVLVTGEEFVQAMEEGRKRVAGRSE